MQFMLAMQRLHLQLLLIITLMSLGMTSAGIAHKQTENNTDMTRLKVIDSLLSANL